MIKQPHYPKGSWVDHCVRNNGLLLSEQEAFDYLNGLTMKGVL